MCLLFFWRVETSGMRFWRKHVLVSVTVSFVEIYLAIWRYHTLLPFFILNCIDLLALISFAGVFYSQLDIYQHGPEWLKDIVRAMGTKSRLLHSELVWCLASMASFAMQRRFTAPFFFVLGVWRYWKMPEGPDLTASTSSPP